MRKKQSVALSLFTIVFMLLLLNTNIVQADSVKDLFEDEQPTEENEKNEVFLNEENKDNIAEEIGSKNSSLIWNLIKMVFVLGLILGLIYFVLRFINKRNRFGQQEGILENLSGISVGQNKQVQLIRVGQRVYLLGVGDNVEMLQEITDEQEKAEIIHKSNLNNNISNSFITDLFKNKFSKDSSKQNDDSDFQELFSNELKKIQETRKEIIDQHTEKEDRT